MKSSATILDQKTFLARWERWLTSGSLSKERALTIAIVITLAAMVVEFIASLMTGSLMLFSDALHMLSHASSLGVTFIAMILAKKVVGKNFPFGFHRIEILAALFNGFSLLLFTGYVIYEAIIRIYDPLPVDSFETIMVAIFGLIVNLLTALVLSRSNLEDLNTKSAFLHLLADTFSSVTIVIGGIIIFYTDWFIIDAILSVVVAGVILKWSWGLLRDASLVLMERTPHQIDIDEIEEKLLEKFNLVEEVDRISIWEITNDQYFGMLRLTCKKTTADNCLNLTKRVKMFLMREYQLTDVNIELGIAE